MGAAIASAVSASHEARFQTLVFVFWLGGCLGMSFSVQEAVWRTPMAGSTAKYVLLALARRADDDGGRVFPSLATIAKDCDLTDRSVRAAVRRLEKLGIVELVVEADPSRHRAREYRIRLDRLTGQAESPSAPLGNDVPREGGSSFPTLGKELPGGWGTSFRPLGKELPPTLSYTQSLDPVLDSVRDAGGKSAELCAFAGQVIRLNQADFERWRAKFSAIPDLTAKLVDLDGWISKQPEAARKGWFQKIDAILSRDHTKNAALQAGLSNLHFEKDCHHGDFEQRSQTRRSGSSAGSSVAALFAGGAQIAADYRGSNRDRGR